MASSDIALTALLENAENVPELYDAVRAFAQARQFSSFLFGVRVPVSLAKPVHFSLSGFPKEWRKHYDEAGYLRVDPVVRHALSSSVPIFWDEIERSDALVGAFFNEAASFGLAHGVSAPICGRRGEVGVLSLARESVIDDCEVTRFELRREMTWFATVLHEAVSRVAFTASTQREVARLSEREKQILMWTAAGESSATIATELGIAERTVLFHIEKAGKKMGVTGRHKIVSRAVGSGALALNQVALQSTRALPTTQEFSV